MQESERMAYRDLLLDFISRLLVILRKLTGLLEHIPVEEEEEKEEERRRGFIWCLLFVFFCD